VAERGSGIRDQGSGIGDRQKILEVLR